MNIKVEETGACRKTVHIEVPADQVSSEFNSVLAAYAHQARIPGFRPGRAPRDLVKKRFSKEIHQEVKERLIPRGYQEAIQKEKLETIAVVDVREENVEDGHSFSFSVILDVSPSFELPNYSGIALESKVAEVTEADINKALDNVRDQGSRYEEITGRPVQKGDFAQIDYEGVSEGKPIEELAPKAKGLGKGEGFWVVVEDENSFLPGFAQQLVGASIGDKKQVSIDFPADYVEPALAGKKATYSVEIKALREKKLTDIDETFLKSLGVDSEEALRDRIKNELKAMRENNEKRRLQNEIAKYLLEKTAMDLPSTVLQEETRHEVYDMVQNSTQRGIARESIEEKKEEIFETAARNASEKVKLRFILRRIANQEKYAVTDQELNERINWLAYRYQVPPEKVRAQLEKNHSVEKLKEDVLMNKTLALLLEKANVKAT